MPQGLVRPERLGKLIKIIHLTGSRTHDLPVSNTACLLYEHIGLPKSTGFDYHDNWHVTCCNNCSGCNGEKTILNSSLGNQFLTVLSVLCFPHCKYHVSKQLKHLTILKSSSISLRSSC
jgi:hypothetical protein